MLNSTLFNELSYKFFFLYRLPYISRNVLEMLLMIEKRLLALNFKTSFYYILILNFNSKSVKRLI